MMPFLLTFMLPMLVMVASLSARRKALRRERSQSMLSRSDEPARGLLSILASDLRNRAQRRARSSSLLAAAALMFSLFIFTRNPLLALGAWPAVTLARRLLERHRLRRTGRMKEEQVLEFIDSLRQSLRSGLSLRRALQISMEDIGEELGEDVEEILRDIHTGGGLEESLVMAAERSPSPSPRLTFTVLGLLHGKGGDLPHILERLRERVAEGLEARREARILTSQSRASGYLVSSLPALFLLAQAALNPRSLHPLFATPLGNLIITVALALNASAFFLIRRMVDPEV